MWKCSECGSPVDEGDRFCRKCGGRLEFDAESDEGGSGWKCAGCGAAVSREDKRCRMCGSHLDFEESTSNSSPQRNIYALSGLALGIAAIFLSFVGIIPVAGLALSAIGLARSPERGGRMQATIGIVLGSVYTMVYLNQYGYLG
ncbi:zinc-ribbon domain-containing protein [bacterium]|nr:zinc-ribbon domain-containing protein [bacterium]